MIEMLKLIQELVKDKPELTRDEIIELVNTIRVLQDYADYYTKRVA